MNSVTPPAASSWHLSYLPGGRELLQALGQQLVLGESFAFLGPQWGHVPLIASILRAAGVKKAPPRIYSLWGQQELELPGALLKQRILTPHGLCSIWTDRQFYREGRDPVRVVMADPFSPQTQVDVELFHEGQPFGRQPLYLDEHGLCLIELQDLPAGRYRIQTHNGHAQVTFTVAFARLCTMTASWLQQYAQEIHQGRRTLVFVLQLESFGAAVQGDVVLQLLDESGDTPKPLSQGIFRADGGGRVAGELALEGDGPFSLEIHALTDNTKWCSLQVGDEIGGTQQPKRSLICPMGGVKTWQWSGDGGLLGFAVEEEGAWQQAPVVLVHVVGQQAVLRAEQAITEAMMSVLDPITGQIATHTWPQLEPGQQIEVAIARPAGVIAVGGWVQGEPWEGWTMAVPTTTTTLSLQLLPRQQHGEPLYVELSTNHPATLPVYVVAREEEEAAEHRPWGPAAALHHATHTTSKHMAVGTPKRQLWREADILIRAAEKEAAQQKRGIAMPASGRPGVPPPASPPPGEIPRPGIAPPSKAPPGAPPPSSPPPTAVRRPDLPTPTGQIPTPPTPPAPAWERPPPQHEHFSKTHYCGILPVTGRHILAIDLPDEYTQLHIEAVAMAGPSWAYARAETTHGESIFAELLLPESIHPNDAVTGEIVIATQDVPVYAALWCEEQPVPLYLQGQPHDPNTPLHEPLTQLTCPVVPGHYILQVRAQAGEAEEIIEAQVGRWGERLSEAWGVQLLAPGSHWSNEDPLVEGDALPGLASPIQRVARSLLESAAGHCETEAARVCAAAYALHFAQASHEESIAYHQLLQGLERLEGMRVPGMGFRLYPGGPHDPTWGIEAVHHLWELAWLPAANPSALPEWHRRVLQIADEMAHCYRLSPIPSRIHNARDAALVIRREQMPTRQEEAIWEIEQKLIDSPKGTFYNAPDPAAMRRQSCYAAAALLSTHQDQYRQRGVAIANWALRQWSAEEAGYSSLEGIALLSLLNVCQSFLPPNTEASAQLDGQLLDWQLLRSPRRIQHIQVTAGAVPIGLRYHRVSINLQHFASPTPWHTKLQKLGPNSPEINELEIGERAHINITLPQHGQLGDLLEFFLPPALCWLDGERDERHFAVEVQGETLVSLPVVAIATTQNADGQIGSQHWGLRLSNMYDGARGNASFERTITVYPSGHRRREQGVFRRMRKLFG